MLCKVTKPHFRSGFSFFSPPLTPEAIAKCFKFLFILIAFFCFGRAMSWVVPETAEQTRLQSPMRGHLLASPHVDQWSGLRASWTVTPKCSSSQYLRSTSPPCGP